MYYSDELNKFGGWMSDLYELAPQEIGATSHLNWNRRCRRFDESFWPTTSKQVAPGIQGHSHNHLGIV
jgi:hypothetical protein